ncbi:SNF2-related protein [uncultured Alistipes sp.]|uniref:SNF2-related protein n=1 Tax=uncultured Alistipes sp. TaxID=538949 RepID=UPI002592AB36|nr:SNF2-related protein [uncultured Alistipes sp.]
MNTSPFHIYSKARELAGFVNDDELLIAAFASSDIGIYPYQIAAARFALHSPYLKGVILADEGSLGKTFEALLIATQRWYEGKNRQLLVLPPNLTRQWTEKIERYFTLPYVLIDTEQAFVAVAESADNPFDQEALIVTTYDFAVEKAECIGRIAWDLAIFDEATQLSKSHTAENRTAAMLKQATIGAFRLLLTPTPITGSIMDIYGLLHFIDETILPDEKDFYDRYFRKPENYAELSGWVSHYCFRTLKSQVAEYVNFTDRIPYTADYALTPDEKALYEMLDAYLSQPRKLAYPKMERYDLTLMYYHTLSSSAQALCRTLDGAISRLEEMRSPDFQGLIDKEKRQLIDIRACAGQVTVSGKMTALLAILKKCFSRLGQIGAERKALIFTDNKVTQRVLRNLLAENGYPGVVTYSGDNGRDYSVIERFRNDKTVQILLATDEAAKGLDIEFCPVVVNYDLLYNAVELEQRITRCHRQGQQSDVLVVNLLGKENFADVRILELINKRVSQFDSIFGLSDAIVGNFDADLDDLLSRLRPHGTIAETFRQNLAEHKEQNLQLVEATEQSIFTTFTKEVADRIALTPEYLEDKIEAVQRELWEVVRWYFADYNHTCGEERYTIDEDAKTITFRDDEPSLPELFYYWSGSRNRPYRSLRQYGMAPDFKPHQGRITLAGILGRHVLDEVCCAGRGTLTVDAELEPCTIGFYAVTVAPKGTPGEWPYFVFAGRTESGAQLTDAECRAIMALPTVDFTEEKVAENSRENYNSRIFTVGTPQRPDRLDTLVSTEECIARRLSERDSALAEELGAMKRRTAVAKTGLEREVTALNARIRVAERELTEASDRLGKIQADKRLKVLQHELRKREDSLFLDRMRLDLQLEQEAEAFVAGQQLTASVARHYIIDVKGKI